MVGAILSPKNRIVIPREVREALGIKPGDKLLLVVRSSRVVIMRKPKSFAKAIRGIARGVYPPDYLQKKRNSWD
jgi:AbrB family looped-hinge helix DNA binding protein